MRGKRIYLDTSIFIAEFDRNDRVHSYVSGFFSKVKKLKNMELCSSKWAIHEMNNKLTKKKLSEFKIAKYIRDMLDKSSTRSVKIRFLDVSSNKNYDFNHFFNDLGKDLIKYKTGRDRPGLGDIMHIRIMKNNRVNIVASFDSHFEKIPGITCINPSNQEWRIGKEYQK